MIERQAERLNNIRERAEKATAALNTLKGNPSVLEGLSGEDFLKQAVKVGKISLAVQSGAADFDKPRTKLASLIQRAGLVEQIGKATEAGAYGEGGVQVLDKALTEFDILLRTKSEAPAAETPVIPPQPAVVVESPKTQVVEAPVPAEGETPTSAQTVSEQLEGLWTATDRQPAPAVEPAEKPAGEKDTFEDIDPTLFGGRSQKVLEVLKKELDGLPRAQVAEKADIPLTQLDGVVRLINTQAVRLNQDVQVGRAELPRPADRPGGRAPIKHLLERIAAKSEPQVASEPSKPASGLESEAATETGSRPAKAEREPIIVLGKSIAAGGQIRKAIELLAGASENRMVMISALLNEFFAENLKAGVHEKILKARLSVVLANAKKLLEPEIEVINPIPKGSKDEARYFLRLKGEETSPTATQLDNLEEQIRAELGEGNDTEEEALATPTAEAVTIPALPLSGSERTQSQEAEQPVDPRLSSHEQLRFAQVLSSVDPKDLAELGIRISADDTGTLLEVIDSLREIQDMEGDITYSQEVLERKLVAFVRDNEAAFKANENNEEAEFLLMFLVGLSQEYEVRELLSIAPVESEKRGL